MQRLHSLKHQATRTNNFEGFKAVGTPAGVCFGGSEQAQRGAQVRPAAVGPSDVMAGKSLHALALPPPRAPALAPQLSAEEAEEALRAPHRLLRARLVHGVVRQVGLPARSQRVVGRNF